MTSYKIVNTTKNDLKFIYWLFEMAIAYQKRKNYTVWRGYDKNVLQKDIENKLQYKILVEEEIACIFSICYADPIIWREKDKGDAIYLHRIVVNPNYKGHKQFEKILSWAIEHAKQKRLNFIRMDTWADNSNIVGYYKSFGFKFLENYITPDAPELPITHRNLGLALLEYNLN